MEAADGRRVAKRRHAPSISDAMYRYDAEPFDLPALSHKAVFKAIRFIDAEMEAYSNAPMEELSVMPPDAALLSYVGRGTEAAPELEAVVVLGRAVGLSVGERGGHFNPKTGRIEYDCVCLAAVEVHPDFRRQGAFRRLTRAILSACNTLCLSNGMVVAQSTAEHDATLLAKLASSCSYTVLRSTGKLFVFAPPRPRLRSVRRMHEPPPAADDGVTTGP